MSENSDSQTALRRLTHDHDDTSTAQARAGALMSPPPFLGPGRYPQYTRADCCQEAVGVSTTE